MKIVIERENSIPIYQQIVRQLREMILNGSLPPGFSLPPERRLAEELGVNRSTVLNAYYELKADGLVAAHVGQGTVVLPRNNHPGPRFQPPEELPWRQFFNESALRSRDTLVRNILELISREGIISFAAGIPSPTLDSMDDFREIQEQLYREKDRAAFLHTPVDGYPPLKKTIGSLMEERGVQVRPQEIMVLAGSQQGIDLVARTLVEPGDVVIVEEPTFFCALQTFRAAGARVIGVPVDEQGMQTGILKKLIERYQPKLIYTIPTFQNPSGATMSLERRLELLDLAYSFQIPILEDDPYSLLRYEGNPVPSLQSLDRYGYVIYLSTFSKVLFPGWRIGWLVAPEPVIRQFIWMRQNMDLHANSLSQWLLERFLTGGNHFERHLAILKREYRGKRDLMLNTLTELAPPGLTWNRPEGGYYIWCRLPERVRAAALLNRAVKERVAFVPGEAFYLDGPGQNYIRLNFSYPETGLIEEGLRRLIKVIAEINDEGTDYDHPGMEISPIL